MTVSIKLPHTTEMRLAGLAKLTGRTKAFCLRELIERGIDDLEDYYLAASESALVKSGEAQVISSQEMRARIGLGN